MRIEHIPIGDNPPESLNVVIEVPTGGEPVKYEFDKKSAARCSSTASCTRRCAIRPTTASCRTPCRPTATRSTRWSIARSPFIPGCVVRARPIGVLKLEDEHGGDEKLICVPVDTTFPYYSDVGERQDLPSIVLQQIEHFFKHYKDLEDEKWVRVGEWGDAAEARRIVLEAIERAQAGEAA